MQSKKKITFASNIVKNAKPYSEEDESLYNLGKDIFSKFGNKKNIKVEKRVRYSQDHRSIVTTEFLKFPKPFKGIYLTRRISIHPLDRKKYTTHISTDPSDALMCTGYNAKDIEYKGTEKLKRMLELETGVLLI